MLIIKRPGDLSKTISERIFHAKTIGLVPTMGALHQGHLSLLDECKSHCDIAVASIFVNPAQFNNREDFKKYPVSVETDIYKLERQGCDILFLPDVQDMYPDPSKTQHFDLAHLEIILEGKYRPGHFQGVCSAVKKLLEVITPTSLYMGQKDYQQCLVIKKLVLLLKSNTQIVICKTVRETDGLAMSSRNLRLTEKERKKAPALYHALNIIKKGLNHDNVADVRKQACSILRSADFNIDYVEVADGNTLMPVENIKTPNKIVALIAASINNIRLIDNLIIHE